MSALPKEAGVAISLVPGQDIYHVWPRAATLLEPAVERSHGRWTIMDLFDSIVGERQQLWIAFDDRGVIACVTTQVISYPSLKMLACQFAGGEDMEAWWTPMRETIESYASDIGCGGVEAGGRFGFWPKAKADGYERVTVACQKMFEEK
jgi:hypothetical protein